MLYINVNEARRTASFFFAMKRRIKTIHQQVLNDLISPVSAYLKLRDAFPNAVLLESSDYKSSENSTSIIGLKPIVELIVESKKIQIKGFPDLCEIKPEYHEILEKAYSYLELDETPFDFEPNAFMGYASFESVELMEDIDFPNSRSIPDIRYAIYEFVLVFDHYHNELYIFQNSDEPDHQQIEHLLSLLKNPSISEYPFETVGQETSEISNDEMLAIFEKGKTHIQQGDVFQVVLSRKFMRRFTGDEFNVYRSLRNINPSPYLFYFDYGSYKLLGASPEAQLKVVDGKAEIHPIAGTYKKTGNLDNDLMAAEQLKSDAKEMSEHVMLVDLARNDLNRCGGDAKVEQFAEIQAFSHVIHMVSKVTSVVDPISIYHCFEKTFPAGTLSGAPKYRALQIINELESPRTFYGGAIGIIGKKMVNTAIIIRSVLSINNQLIYQAGAGIVAKSIPEKELEEIENKIAAIRKAIKHASSSNTMLGYERTKMVK